MSHSPFFVFVFWVFFYTYAQKEAFEYLILVCIFYMLVWNIVIIYFIISFLNFQCSCCTLVGFFPSLKFQEGKVKRYQQQLWNAVELFLKLYIMFSDHFQGASVRQRRNPFFSLSHPTVSHQMIELGCIRQEYNFLLQFWHQFSNTLFFVVFLND